MRFNLALIPSFLLASAALADRRGYRRRSSPLLLRGSPSETYGGTASVIYDAAKGDITSITGTLVVPPHATGPKGSDSFVGFALDPTCGSGSFAAGVIVTAGEKEPSYTGVYAWIDTQDSGPAGVLKYTFSAGDSYKFTLKATSPTSGTLEIVNLRTGAELTTPIKDAPRLCEENAAFLAGPFNNATLAYLDTVKIMDATVSGPKKTYQASDYSGIEGAEINKKKVIDTTVSGSTVTFTYHQ